MSLDPIDRKRRLHSAAVRLRRAEIALSEAQRERDQLLAAHPHTSRMSHEERAKASIPLTVFAAVKEAREQHTNRMYELQWAFRSLTPAEVKELGRVWAAEHERRTGLTPDRCRPGECVYGDEPEGVNHG